MSIFTVIKDFLSKFIRDSIRSSPTIIYTLTISDILISIIWTIILSLTIAITYRGTHKNVSYSQNFAQSLVILSVVVSFVMVIVGTDIARAFTLVGALSIIRFRNAIKDTKDVSYIFFSMVVGMGCGVRFFSYSILFVFIVCSLLFLMSIFNFGQLSLSQDIIEMNFPTKVEYSKVLKPIFQQNLKYYSLLSVISIDETLNRISFLITFKKQKKNLISFQKLFKNRTPLDLNIDFQSKLLNNLQKQDFISEIKIISGAHSIEL